MRKLEIIEDNNGLATVKDQTYIRCPYGLIVMNKVHMKQGCTSDCAAFHVNAQIVKCQAGNFEIGILVKEE